MESWASWWPELQSKRSSARTGFVDLIKKEGDSSEVQLSKTHMQDLAAGIAEGFNFTSAMFAQGSQPAMQTGTAPSASRPEVPRARFPVSPVVASPLTSTNAELPSPASGSMFGFKMVVPQLPGVSTAALATPTKKHPPQEAGATPRQPTAKAFVTAGGQGGKGRKKRDLIKESTRVVGEFAVAGSDHATYFGTGAKVMIQWMTRPGLSYEHISRDLRLDLHVWASRMREKIGTPREGSAPKKG